MIRIPLRKSTTKLCHNGVIWQSNFSSISTSKYHLMRKNRAIIPNPMLQIRSMSRISGTIPKGGFGISVSHYAKVRTLSYNIYSL